MNCDVVTRDSTRRKRRERNHSNTPKTGFARGNLRNLNLLSSRPRPLCQVLSRLLCSPPSGLRTSPRRISASSNIAISPIRGFHIYYISGNLWWTFSSSTKIQFQLHSRGSDAYSQGVFVTLSGSYSYPHIRALRLSPPRPPSGRIRAREDGYGELNMPFWSVDVGFNASLAFSPNTTDSSHLACVREAMLRL